MGDEVVSRVAYSKGVGVCGREYEAVCFVASGVAIAIDSVVEL